MFYYVDSNDNLWFRFIYNDSDRSVRLYTVAELVTSGVEITSNYNNEVDYRKGSANWTKLKVLGAKEYDIYLHRMLYCYKINRDRMDLTLMIDGYSNECFLNLYRHSGVFMNNKLRDRRTPSARESNVLNIRIPNIMASYVMHLYGYKDFDSLVGCMHNYLGSEVWHIVDDFRNRVNVEFQGWL